MNPLGLIAGSRYAYATGASGTVTVPNGSLVIGLSCMSVNQAGTLTIAPGGANQTGAVGGAIPIPQTGAYVQPIQAGLMQLGGGTVFVFAGTDSYVVEYAILKMGS